MSFKEKVDKEKLNRKIKEWRKFARELQETADFEESVQGTHIEEVLDDIEDCYEEDVDAPKEPAQDPDTLSKEEIKKAVGKAVSERKRKEREES